MHIERVGFTPLKGGRHVSHEHVDLTEDGPPGDRVFCLVDRARGRVVRTVENPSLLRVIAHCADGVLSAALPGGTVAGVPAPTGERLEVDYWGRVAAVEVCAGPWAAAYSGYLGYDVVLARSAAAGEVVYAGPVSIVTTSSLRHLSERLGRAVSSARFRPTFLLDTGDADAHVEDGWVGQELRLGEATVRVDGILPRCAVVDLDPVTGVRDARVLQTLGGYRRGTGAIEFGVHAVVISPGRVCTGDRAEPGRD